MDEHSSLLRKSVNYDHKKFYSTGPWPVAKNFLGRYGRIHYIRLALITEGAAEQVSQFVMPLKPVYDKMYVLTNKNVILNFTEKLKYNNNFIIIYIF